MSVYSRLKADYTTKPAKPNIIRLSVQDLEVVIGRAGLQGFMPITLPFIISDNGKWFGFERMVISLPSGQEYIKYVYIKTFSGHACPEYLHINVHTTDNPVVTKYFQINKVSGWCRLAIWTDNVRKLELVCERDYSDAGFMLLYQVIVSRKSEEEKQADLEIARRKERDIQMKKAAAAAAFAAAKAFSLANPNSSGSIPDFSLEQFSSLLFASTGGIPDNTSSSSSSSVGPSKTTLGDSSEFKP
ncbi:hypothetical protein ADUPG1_011914, partial [Aduncisulcus paluster]